METAIADRPAQIQAAAIGYSRHLLRTQSRAEAHLNGEEESKTDTCIAQEVEHRVNVAKIRMHPTGLVDVEMLSNLLGVNRFAHCEKTCHFALVPILAKAQSACRGRLGMTETVNRWRHREALVTAARTNSRATTVPAPTPLFQARWPPRSRALASRPAQ